MARKVRPDFLLDAATVAEIERFWNDELGDDVRQKIVNVDRWKQEQAIHVDAIFRASTDEIVRSVLDHSICRRVVDVGVGVGRLSAHVAAHANAVVGLDVSPRMIEGAKTYLSERGRLCRNQHGDATFERGLVGLGLLKPYRYEWRDVGIGPKSVDVVFSFLTLQHVPTRAMVEHYLDEAFDCLVDGGRLRVQTLQAPPKLDGELTFHGATFESIDEFAATVESAGFSILEKTVGLGCDRWLWITAKK